MRSLENLMSHLRGLGVTMWADGDQLRCRAERQIDTQIDDRTAGSKGSNPRLPAPRR